MCQSGDYEISRKKQLLKSGLELLTWRLGRQRGWLSFCLGGGDLTWTSMDSTTKTNGNIILPLSYRLMGLCKGGPSRTHRFGSTHYRKN